MPGGSRKSQKELSQRSLLGWAGLVPLIPSHQTSPGAGESPQCPPWASQRSQLLQVTPSAGTNPFDTALSSSQRHGSPAKAGQQPWGEFQLGRRRRDRREWRLPNLPNREQRQLQPHGSGVSSQQHLLLGAQRGQGLFWTPRNTMMWLLVTISCFMLIAAKSEENPEVSMDVGEIVRYHGYPYEEHEVLTEDGYFLTLQRIPHGRGSPGSFSLSHKAGAQPSNMFCPPPKAVVLLQHGLVLEGSNWVTNLPNTSLGFILADAGYDVWIGNSRGNSWSRKHQEFEFHQQEYSAYSFHEMAMYDLPASINYILQRTGQEQLYYVAYSQGTTTGFIAFSSIPELDRKIKMFFALAPITVNSNMKSPLVRVFDLPEVLIKIILGQTVVFDKGEVLKQVISTMCTYPMLKTVCSLVFYLPGGFTNSLNVSRMDVYLARYPDSTSLKNMLHWRQLYQTGEFKHYDYGSDNVLHYNQTTPPFYELENMKTPLAAWYGGKDWISAPEDVNITLPRISNVAYKKYIPEFVHFDFLWGKQVYEQVYKEMLDLMEKGA